MAKSRNRAVDFGIYVIVRLTAALLRALPFQSALRLCGVVTWALMKISPRRVQIARDNLRHAFPQQSSEWIEHVIIKMYQHFSRSIFEVIQASRFIRASNWRRHYEFGSSQQRDLLTEAIRGKRAVIFFTAHFGNWELTGYGYDMMGHTGYTIARPMDNPFVERWVRRVRESSGQTILAKNGEIRAIEKVLRDGQILKLLGDQDAGPRGLFVPFFGRPASTHRSVALFALRHKALIMVTASARIEGDLRFRMYIEDLIDPLDYKRSPDAAQAITARSVQALERIIRRHPEQYLWTHRRWKNQPTAPIERAA